MHFAIDKLHVYIIKSDNNPCFSLQQCANTSDTAEVTVMPQDRQVIYSLHSFELVQPPQLLKRACQ